MFKYNMQDNSRAYLRLSWPWIFNLQGAMKWSQVILYKTASKKQSTMKAGRPITALDSIGYLRVQNNTIKYEILQENQHEL